MDESGRKDAEGDAPVEQQGIFSSPDLAINSENLEQIKPELSEDNKSRIASAFAMTDATQKHDQLSEQMADQNAISGTVLPAGAGPISISNSTTSSAIGDIHLPGAKKKSKLPLVLAALVVLAAVGGGVAYGMLNGWGDNERSPEPALSISDIVNFANYSLSEYGQQILANGYVSTRAYRLEQQVKLAQAVGGNAEYFSGLGETFDTVYNNVQGLFNEETNFTSSDLTDMRDRISVIRQFVSGNKLTSQNITALYLAQGNSIMQQAVESEALKYEALENNTIAKEYAAVIRETALLIAITYDAYAQHGCIQNSAVNAECVASIPDGEVEVLDLNDDRIVRFIYDAVQQVEQATFMIYWSMDETVQD